MAAFSETRETDEFRENNMEGGLPGGKEVRDISEQRQREGWRIRDEG